MKRSAVALLLATILCALFTSCSRDPNVRKQKYLESGKRYYEKTKYREAVIQFSNALQVDPRFAEAHYQLAQTYLKLGVFPSAYNELVRTVELQPDNDKAQIDLGNLLLASRNLDEAEKRAKLVLGKHPDNADAHGLMGNIQAARGSNEAALQEMRKAIELSPNRAQFHTNLGIFYQNAKQFAEAEAAYKKAVELDSKSANALLTLAAFYVGQQRWTDAEPALERAVQADPNSTPSRIALARFYLIQGKKDRAVQVLSDAKKAMPTKPEGYRLLGDYYLSSGQTDQALAEYASLLEEHKEDLPLKKVYISTLLQKNRVEEASRLNDEILKKNSKDVEALIAKGRILIQQRKANDAVLPLEAAIKSDPGNPAAHYFLALAADETGDTTRREKELREAVRLRPDFVEAQAALGTVALRKRDWDTLNSAGESLVKAQPNAPQGYVMRAMAKVNRKDQAGSEADLNKAIQVAPQNPIGYLRLGELRLSARRYKEADQLFEQALERDPNSVEAMQALLASGTAQKLPSSKLVARVNAQIAKAPNSAFYAMLGGLEAQAHDFPNAVQHLQKAIEMDKNNAAAFGMLAQVQFASGSSDQAIATYQSWIQQNPKDVRPYLMLGALHDLKNNWQQAQQMYQKALEISPDLPVAANNLAYSMLQHGGNTDVALSMAQVARRGMQDTPNSADTLAWAYYHKGAYGMAIDLLQDAIKKSPDNATYQYHLGLAYMKQNDRARAKEHLQKALQLNPKFPDAEDARKSLEQLRG